MKKCFNRKNKSGLIGRIKVYKAMRNDFIVNKIKLNKSNKNTQILRNIDSIATLYKMKQQQNQVPQHQMQLAMQQLASHFNRKKSQFVGFFSSIIQVIQKLAYDIQAQIDKEYYLSVTEFKNHQPNAIMSACIKMEQNRVQVYHQMIDRLYGTLKGFASQMAMGQPQGIQNLSSIDQQVPQIKPKKILTNVGPSSSFDGQTKPQRPMNQPIQADSSSQVIRLGQSSEASRQLDPRTPVNSQKPTNHQPTSFKIPSPFASKQLQNQLKQSTLQQVQQSSTQRSKQKIEILKKTDVCQSLDNYLNKQAKQMLQRSLSRQSSFSSMRKSMTKKYDTPERSNYQKEYESSEIDRRIEGKLGGYGDMNGKYQSIANNNGQNGGGKKVIQNMVSPIQRYKFY